MANRGRRSKTRGLQGRQAHRVKMGPRAQGVQVVPPDSQAYKVLPGPPETNHLHPLGILGAQLRALQDQEDEGPEGWVVLSHPANGQQQRST